MYTEAQKEILLNRFNTLSRKQRVSLVHLYFSIISVDKPTQSDFDKIERELDLFNLTLDSLSGYTGWDIAANDLIPLPQALKEFIFLCAIEFLYVDGRINEKRGDRFDKIFNKLGISEEKGMEIMEKARHLRNEFGF